MSRVEGAFQRVSNIFNIESVQERTSSLIRRIKVIVEDFFDLIKKTFGGMVSFIIRDRLINLIENPNVTPLRMTNLIHFFPPLFRDSFFTAERRDRGEHCSPLGVLLYQNHVSFELIQALLEGCPEAAKGQLFAYNANEANDIDTTRSVLHLFFLNTSSTSRPRLNGRMGEVLRLIVRAFPTNEDRYLKSLFHPSLMLYLVYSKMLEAGAIRALYEVCPLQHRESFLNIDPKGIDLIELLAKQKKSEFTAELVDCYEEFSLKDIRSKNERLAHSLEAWMEDHPKP